jgi:bacterioferritin-associated ferredoxin
MAKTLTENEMKLEKYDLFQWLNEVVQYTGFQITYQGEVAYIFTDVKSDGEADNLFFTKEEIKSSEFKKLPPPVNHPVVLESAKLTRDNPEIREQFARMLAIQFSASTPAQKRDIIELLIKELPRELRNALVCGELCGQCNECSKRIMRTVDSEKRRQQ